MVKTIVFVLLLMMYPLFLQIVKVHDFRAVPLIVPYALASLAVIVLASELAGWIGRRLARKP